MSSLSKAHIENSSKISWNDVIIIYVFVPAFQNFFSLLQSNPTLWFQHSIPLSKTNSTLHRNKWVTTQFKEQIITIIRAQSIIRITQFTTQYTYLSPWGNQNRGGSSLGSWCNYGPHGYQSHPKSSSSVLLETHYRQLHLELSCRCKTLTAQQ